MICRKFAKTVKDEAIPETKVPLLEEYHARADHSKHNKLHLLHVLRSKILSADQMSNTGNLLQKKNDKKYVMIHKSYMAKHFQLFK
jgi:hypothetical protein